MSETKFYLNGQNTHGILVMQEGTGEGVFTVDILPSYPAPIGPEDGLLCNCVIKYPDESEVKFNAVALKHENIYYKETRPYINAKQWFRRKLGKSFIPSTECELYRFTFRISGSIDFA